MDRYGRALLHLIVGGLASAPSATATQPPSDLGWKLHAEIGMDRGGTSGVFFSQITTLAFVDDTTFVVADAGEANLRFFTTRGGLLRAVGRKGAGPGEFMLPAVISVDTVVRVFDPQQHREVVFTRTGDHLATRRVTATRMMNVTRLHPVSRHLRVGVTTPLHGSARDQRHFLVFAINDSTGILDTLGVYHSGITMWRAQRGRGGVGLVLTRFGPGGAMGIRDSIVVLADGYSGHVRWLVPSGDTLRLMREEVLEAVSRPISDAEIAATRDQWIDYVAGRGLELSSVEIEPAPAWSVAHRVLVERDGTTWILVEVGARGGVERLVLSPALDAERWIVLSPTGRREDFWLSPGFSLMDVSEELAAGVYRDSDGVQIVRVYRRR